MHCRPQGNHDLAERIQAHICVKCEKLKITVYHFFWFGRYGRCQKSLWKCLLSNDGCYSGTGVRAQNDFREKGVDIKGFEPLTFSMQSRRSTTDLNALISGRKKWVIHTMVTLTSTSTTIFIRTACDAVLIWDDSPKWIQQYFGQVFESCDVKARCYRLSCIHLKRSVIHWKVRCQIVQ